MFALAWPSAYSGLPMFIPPLPQKKNLSLSQARVIGSRRIPLGKKSFSPKGEKKRGELESAERGSAKQAPPTQPKQNSARSANSESFVRGLHLSHRHLFLPLSRIEGTTLSGAT
jgi:hypothetical protein